METEIIGFLAGLIVAVSMAPQLIKSWRTRSTKDISLSWTILLLIGLVLWIVYGVRIGSRPIMVFTSIEMVLSLSLVVLKLRYK